jgi:hypothetical protein
LTTFLPLFSWPSASTIAAARAYGAVRSAYADGQLNNGKNVVKTWRAGTGRYCVTVDERIDAGGALIQITPRNALRLPHIAYRNKSANCHYEENTISVNVYSTSTGRLADGGFDLSIA